MKVLYIGHYREGTGWGQAALDYINSLDAAGVDLVCRPIILGNNVEPSDRIKELEQRDSLGATHVIQHVMPHYMDFNGQLKNVGLFVSETDSIQYTGWPQRLSMMDSVWVPNTEMVKVCKDVGIKNIEIVPHATDPSKYDEVEPLPIGSDEFMFYFVGENNRRKRIAALLQTYYTTFNHHDNVVLVIKTTDGVGQIDETVRKNLRLYPNDRMYPKVLFITERISDEDMMRLHARGDAFITCTYGDAWSIPAFEAMCMGNWVISPSCGGMSDYLQHYQKGLLIDGQYRPVFGADVIFDDLHTGHENWFELNLNDTSKCMKILYDNRKNKGKVRNNNKEMVDLYSYESIGTLMKEKLQCLG